jgi:UDPglucose 6-dehydrogenase
MKITVIGTGYVGLVSGACLAEMGNHVLCLDLNLAKIERLNRGELPIYEPGLAEIVRRNVEARRLQFSSDVALSVQHGTLQFIAVGTPPGEDGSADLQYVMNAARSIGQEMTDYKLIIDKSTVPVGTADKVTKIIEEALKERGLNLNFSVASNPEFLKEGAAVADFMRPDRIILGVNDERSELLLRALYQPFVRNHDRILVMDRRSSELTKYAANAMLATRISFMNELSRLAELIGADIEQVRQGIGSDPRIGLQFLYPGCGYGGSCFPKDVKALGQSAEEVGLKLRLLEAVETVNDEQKQVLCKKIVERYGEDLSGLVFAIWGLSFKPSTDDVREAPSFVVIKELLARGASVQAYDPVAIEEAKKSLGPQDRLTFAGSAYLAAQGANALVIVTEWKEFRTPDFDELKATLTEAIIFDGRNLYSPEIIESYGFQYYPIGRPQWKHDSDATKKI